MSTVLHTVLRVISIMNICTFLLDLSNVVNVGKIVHGRFWPEWWWYSTLLLVPLVGFEGLWLYIHQSKNTPAILNRGAVITDIVFVLATYLVVFGIGSIFAGHFL